MWCIVLLCTQWKTIIITDEFFSLIILYKILRLCFSHDSSLRTDRVDSLCVNVYLSEELNLFSSSSFVFFVSVFFWWMNEEKERVGEREREREMKWKIIKWSSSFDAADNEWDKSKKKLFMLASIEFFITPRNWLNSVYFFRLEIE